MPAGVDYVDNVHDTQLSCPVLSSSDVRWLPFRCRIAVVTKALVD